MAFWTDGIDKNSREPKRKFRFKVSITQINDSGMVWWAKTVTKPNYEISEAEHTFLTHKFYYPGRVTWGEVELVLVDPISPGAVEQLNKLVESQGYIIPSSDGSTLSGLETMTKGKGSAALGTCEIIQLDAEGNNIETWTLHNPFIKGVKYGDLDYTSEDLIEVTLTLRYDWAKCVTASKDSSDAADGAAVNTPAFALPTDK
mgnify:CR=1 FL=1